MTPSEFELGIEEKEEKSFRWIIAKLINECGIVTRIKHNAILTSLKLMHYIYFKIEISKYDAIMGSKLISGILCFVSHFETDAFVTPRKSAIFSCVTPLSFLSLIIFSPNLNIFLPP